MPFPSSWVDHLFAKFAARYGAAWSRAYQDVDPAAVKADWAEVLDGYEAKHDAIRYGLRYLPVDRPPTATQFREICAKCPSYDIPKLVAPVDPPDPERVRAAVSSAGAASSERSQYRPGEWCAKQIKRIAMERGHMSSAQKFQVAAIEKMLGYEVQP